MRIWNLREEGDFEIERNQEEGELQNQVDCDPETTLGERLGPIQDGQSDRMYDVIASNVMKATLQERI